MKKAVILILTLILVLSLCACRQENEDQTMDAKPVIYLYPETETEVTVTLDYAGTLTTTYPKYTNGWTVTAEPDGTLYLDGEEYSYLFWEGETDVEYDFSQGFCVKGSDTEEFLKKTLAEIGLTPKEYNEFIVYWLPLMEGNEYNIISFQSDAYTDNAKLTITPESDSVLRVFMAWYASDEYTELEPQSFEAFVRDGFTVVEWGGCAVS